MDFIADIWSRAKRQNKTIVLPETEDERILKAAEIIHQTKLAKIILIGKEDGLHSSGARMVCPRNHPKLDKFVQVLKDRRAHRGMTIEEARNLMVDDYPYFGAMLVSQGEADGMVSGAGHFTSHTIKAALECIGKAPGQSIISSFFAMVLNDRQFGEDGTLFYADCGVIPNPDPKQLSEIALQTANSFIKLLDKTPRVAMLSFSTKASAAHADVDKVLKAVEIARNQNPELALDGELQLDAAIVPGVAQKKAPGSIVAGQANILIFPDLDAGNIGYKITERLAHARAFGPIFQGVAKPVNDLSRGCSIEDVVNVVAITAVQAQ